MRSAAPLPRVIEKLGPLFGTAIWARGYGKSEPLANFSSSSLASWS
jgi:hypothetical protein